MKKLFSLMVLTGVLSLGIVSQTVAQDSSVDIKIAVIDINVILREAKAFVSIRDQITKFREVFRSEIQKEEDALREANQKLARQRTILSAEAFAEKRQEFENRVAGVQRLVQQRKKNLDQVQAQAMGQIEQGLNEIVTNIAKEQNISLMLRKDQTILAFPPLQITKQVLKRLNSKIPTITVAEPAS